MLLKLWLALTESIGTMFGMEKQDLRYSLQEKEKLDAAQETFSRLRLFWPILSFIEAFRAEITSQNFMIHNLWLIFIFREIASSICLSWMPQIKKHFNWIKIVHLHCMAVVYVAVVWIATKDVHIAVVATTTIFQIYQLIEMAQKIIIFIRFRNGYKSRLSYVCRLCRLTDIYIQVRILMVTLTLL